MDRFFLKGFTNFTIEYLIILYIVDYTRVRSILNVPSLLSWRLHIDAHFISYHLNCSTDAPGSSFPPHSGPPEVIVSSISLLIPFHINTTTIHLTEWSAMTVLILIFHFAIILYENVFLIAYTYSNKLLSGFNKIIIIPSLYRYINKKNVCIPNIGSL